MSFNLFGETSFGDKWKDHKNTKGKVLGYINNQLKLLDLNRLNMYCFQTRPKYLPTILAQVPVKRTIPDTMIFHAP